MSASSSTPQTLPDELLTHFVSELDDEDVRAIILHGSYVRDDAMPPYSDVDLVRILQEGSSATEQKQFLYHNGYLLSISSRLLSVYRARFAQPEKAIFVVPGIREARPLLDKDGGFHQLQEESRAWTWEPLQAAANTYAAQLMVEQTEIVLKILRAYVLHDAIALADMILDLFSAMTEAMAVYRGVLVVSGNTYFHQVQNAVGRDSLWTIYHLLTAGIATSPLAPPSIEARSVAALHLYKETAHVFHPHVSTEQWEVVTHTIHLMEKTLSHEEVS